MARASQKKPRFRLTNLKAWREYRALSQEALADRVSMSVASISRLETGQQPYTQQTLEALSDALRCEPADLVMRLPPGSEEHQLWDTIRGMKAEDRDFVTGYESLSPEEKDVLRQTARLLKKTGSV